MAFPALVPTSREFMAGEYPVKAFRAQSGAEVRILYGSDRFNAKLSLSFANIADTQAEEFLTHFDEVRGSYGTFEIPSAVLTGWDGSSAAIDAPRNASWRYESTPRVASVTSGISSVTVDLVAVI
jgi:hypothetical protein